ncbi:hypothetical protein VLF92_12560 [Pseudomonas chengduensis]
MAVFYRAAKDFNTGYCYLYTYTPGGAEVLRRVAAESDTVGVLVGDVVLVSSWDGDDLRVMRCTPSANKDTAPPAAVEIHRFTLAMLSEYDDFGYLGSTGDAMVFYGEDSATGVVVRTYFLVSAEGVVRQYRALQFDEAMQPQDLSFQHIPNGLVYYASGECRLVHAEDFT